MESQVYYYQTKGYSDAEIAAGLWLADKQEAEDKAQLGAGKADCIWEGIWEG